MTLRRRLHPKPASSLRYRRLLRWAATVGVTATSVPDSIVGRPSLTRIEEVEHAQRIDAKRRKPGRGRYRHPEPKLRRARTIRRRGPS